MSKLGQFQRGRAAAASDLGQAASASLGHLVRPPPEPSYNGLSPSRESSVHAESASPTSLITEVLALLAAEMAEVDGVIAKRLSSDVALINQIGNYIVHAGGKRMRPKLVLLFANALGFTGPERFELAAVVEFIHTATLLHDDVVDESSLRRGKPTANALFGNAASVLVGDFLYSRAFQMMVSVNRMRVLDVLAEATNVIAEGEVLQLINMHDPDISVESYLRVIRFKTAKLFEASARLGAVLADAGPEAEEACAAYGRSLGTAFQLIDDLLDYEGDTAELGKNVGDDLREGKTTMPLLIAMERAQPEQRALLRHAIEQGEQERLQDIVDIVRSTGALAATREAARAEAQRACDCLRELPANRWTKSLLEFAVQSAERFS
jgi:octaprenyl-diphosphate synthase